MNSRKKIDELINEIKKNPSRKNWFQIDEEEAIFIYEKDFAEAVGIAVIEVMDRDGYRVTDHFYPYVRGANYLYHEDLEFEHYTDKEGYAGICDENNIGIPLIFHVNNPVDYLKIVYGKFHDKINSITLSGMSKKGMIILPVEKDEFQEREERKGNELRNEMIDAAKAGDIEAIAASIAPTEERAKSVDFSDVYYSGSQSLVYRTDEKYTDFSDIKGRTIAVLEGSQSDMIASGENTDYGVVEDATVKRFKNASSAIMELKNKGADAVIIDTIIAEIFCKQTDGIEAVPVKGTEEDTVFCIEKGNTEITELINCQGKRKWNL